MINFDAQIVTGLAMGSHSSWLLHPFDMSPSFPEHFLLYKVVQAHLVRPPHPRPVLEADISLKSIGSFCEKWYLTAKIWVIGVLITIRVSLPSGRLGGQS